MFRPKPLVHQSTTTIGTGPLTLAIENGKQSFHNAYGTGSPSSNLFDYYISHRSAAEWEYGQGYMSDATTLVRMTVIASSSGAGAVNFSAGSKDVSSDYPPDAITNNQLAQMLAYTLKGNPTALNADPQDMTVAQARALLGLGALAYLNTVNRNQIDDNEVTVTKLQDMLEGYMIGRAVGAGTGDPTHLNAGQVRALLNVADGANNYVHPNHTGDVTSVGDGALTIPLNSIGNNKLAAFADGYMMGRPLGSGGPGGPLYMPVAQVQAFLNLANLAYRDTVSRNQIDDNEVITTKLQDMLEGYMIGRASGAGTGDPTHLNSTQVRALLNVANGANNYVHPNHTGDVTSVGDGALTIGTDRVTNVHLANMLANTFKANPTGTGADPQDISIATAQGMLGLSSGATNLTVAAVSNVTTVTIQNPSLYLQVNDIVFVSGQVTVTPTAIGLARIDLSLPIASNLAGSQHCNGAAGGSGGAVGRIYGEPTGDKARFDITFGGTGAQFINFTMMYRVL